MSDAAEMIEKCARALWDEPGWEQASPEQRQHHREAAERALSAVAADIRAEGAAEALHAALYHLEITKNSHDVAECAAPVPGEVGRQDAIDEWISICDEPVEWMRKFAQRYAYEAPSDAYIREVEEEARAEGRREVFDALRMFRAEADKPLAVDLGNMVRAWLDERGGRTMIRLIDHGVALRGAPPRIIDTDELLRSGDVAAADEAASEFDVELKEVSDV